MIGQDADPGNTLTAGVGRLEVVVWPVYVGACTEDPGPGPIAYGEPISVDYARGQISWATERLPGMPEQIVGRAFIAAPAGRYTHLAYFHGPEGPCMSGKMQLPHPIAFPRAGVIEVYPIVNPDMELLKAQGCDV